MRAVQIQKYGASDALDQVELPRPEAGENQVLIRILSAAVNPIDWKLRSGAMKLIYPLSLPAILGFDLSGVVEAVGPGSRKFKVGDEVFSRSNKKSGESYAEWIALDEDVVAAKPAALSHDEAAGVPLAALTALQALRDLGKLQAGQRVLINGGSGGVGSFAVQLAKAMGAHITATCSTANVDFVRSLGAHEVIDYKTSDPLDAALSDHSAEQSQKFDVIFDAVMSFDFKRARRALKPRGHLIATSLNNDLIFSLLVRNHFSSRKTHLILVKSSGADLEYLTELAQKGELVSTIDSVYSLEEIRTAHERSESGRTRGKLVIRIDPGE